MLIKLYLSFSLLFSIPVLSSEYCFKKGINPKSVLRHISPFLLPSDNPQIILEDNCISLSLSELREELIVKAIERKYPIFRKIDWDRGIVQSGYGIQNCNIEITKISKSNLRSRKAKIGSKAGAIQENFKGSAKSVSRLLIGSGRKSYLSVNDQSVEIICNPQGLKNAVLEFSLKGAPGSIATSVLVEIGKNINIGDIVSDINSKEKSIDINKGIYYQDKKGSKKSTYFLKLISVQKF